MTRKAIGILGGVIGLAAGIAITVGVLDRVQGDDTNVILGTSNSEAPCVVLSKENVLQRRPGRKVKWWIRDFTCTRNEVVTVGNFRTSEQSSYRNCENATEGGAAWPFEDGEDPRYRRANPGGKIELKIKGVAIQRAEYYFDICTGSGESQVKSDPRLVIDPSY